MPTYVYKCSKCDLEIELVQKISDEPLHTCPDCKTETLKKVIQPGAFHLKGSGWFRKTPKTDD